MSKLPSYDDLMKYGRTELLSLKSDVERAIVESEKAAREKVLADAKALIEQAGFEVSDLFGREQGKTNTKKSRQSLTHYQNPKNSSEIYKGRGPRPAWFSEFLENGGDKDELIVNS